MVGGYEAEACSLHGSQDAKENHVGKDMELRLDVPFKSLLLIT